MTSSSSTMSGTSRGTLSCDEVLGGPLDDPLLLLDTHTYLVPQRGACELMDCVSSQRPA